MTQYDSLEEAGRDPEWVAEKAINTVWDRVNDDEDEAVTILAFAKVIEFARQELAKLSDDLPPVEEWEDAGVREDIKAAYRN